MQPKDVSGIKSAFCRYNPTRRHPRKSKSATITPPRDQTGRTSAPASAPGCTWVKPGVKPGTEETFPMFRASRRAGMHVFILICPAPRFLFGLPPRLGASGLPPACSKFCTNSPPLKGRPVGSPISHNAATGQSTVSRRYGGAQKRKGSYNTTSDYLASSV